MILSTMNMPLNNIFSNIPQNLPDEVFSIILQQDNILIERIVSKGHSTPTGKWYDQNQNEWILLLQGQATLRLINEQTINMDQGDYYFIPAHLKHRVEWTAPDCETIWLAIHFQDIDSNLKNGPVKQNATDS